MNIVLNATPTTKRSKNQLQARFDTLQKKLLKQQKINQKFNNELDELVTVYQTQMLNMENELLEPLTLLADKLIGFLSRKSLSQWQRQELEEWLGESLNRIGRVDVDTAAELRSRIRQVIAEQMGMTEAELDEEARLFEADVKEAFESFEEWDTDQEEAFDSDDPQVDMFGFEDVFDDGPVDPKYFEEDDASVRDANNKKVRRKRLMDGTWVRNLFRRAAQALHPDREPNPEKRDAKVRSMQQLLEARKHGDIITLLNLYSECTDGDDLILAEQEMTCACELMEEQLNELRSDKQASIYEHPIRMQVHDMLYSGSRKTREKNIELFKQELKAEADHTLDLVEELRNLKVLKIVLEHRREDRMLDEMDMMFDSPW